MNGFQREVQTSVIHGSCLESQPEKDSGFASTFCGKIRSDWLIGSAMASDKVGGGSNL